MSTFSHRPSLERALRAGRPLCYIRSDPERKRKKGVGGLLDPHLALLQGDTQSRGLPSVRVCQESLFDRQTRLSFFVHFFFCLGDCYISRVRAEPAFAALRSRTRTARWWQPHALCTPLQEGQVGVQESPHNTEGLPLFSRGAVRASW
jgi:hypothetical protein